MTEKRPEMTPEEWIEFMRETVADEGIVLTDKVRFLEQATDFLMDKGSGYFPEALRIRNEYYEQVNGTEEEQFNKYLIRTAFASCGLCVVGGFLLGFAFANFLWLIDFWPFIGDIK